MGVSPKYRTSVLGHALYVSKDRVPSGVWDVPSAVLVHALVSTCSVPWCNSGESVTCMVCAGVRRARSKLVCGSGPFPSTNSTKDFRRRNQLFHGDRQNVRSVIPRGVDNLHTNMQKQAPFLQNEQKRICLSRPVPCGCNSNRHQISSKRS